METFRRKFASFFLNFVNKRFEYDIFFFTNFMAIG